jgi:hypothetical protein
MNFCDAYESKYGAAAIRAEITLDRYRFLKTVSP